MSTTSTTDLEDGAPNHDADVLLLIKRNIDVLKREAELGVRIDKSILREMEAEYKRLCSATTAAGPVKAR